MKISEIINEHKVSFDTVTKTIEIDECNKYVVFDDEGVNQLINMLTFLMDNKLI